MEIVTTQVNINGLYEWGDGWVSNLAINRWNDFWRNHHKSVFWKFFEKDNEKYLVSVGGSIYLHPMNFSVLYQEFGKQERLNEDGTRTRVFSQIDDLKEIMAKCCSFCNCECSFQPLKIINA